MIEAWKRETYPSIAVGTKHEKAEIYFWDDSHLTQQLWQELLVPSRSFQLGGQRSLALVEAGDVECAMANAMFAGPLSLRLRAVSARNYTSSRQSKIFSMCQ